MTPYMPVPDTNGEEWDRLEAATGIDALLELIMHGEYNGQDAVRRQKESVDLRATAVGVFEVLIGVSWVRVNTNRDRSTFSEMIT